MAALCWWNWRKIESSIAFDAAITIRPSDARKAFDIFQKAIFTQHGAMAMEQFDTAYCAGVANFIKPLEHKAHRLCRMACAQ